MNSAQDGGSIQPRAPAILSTDEDTRFDKDRIPENNYLLECDVV
jgi:hypothetical protein